MYLKTRAEEATGLLHISDRLLAGELSRVEAARGTLQPLPFFVLSKKHQFKVKYLTLIRYLFVPDDFYSMKINSLQSLALRSFSATVLVEAVVATFTVLPALRSSTLFAIACANLP